MSPPGRRERARSLAGAPGGKWAARLGDEWRDERAAAASVLNNSARNFTRVVGKRSAAPFYNHGGVGDYTSQ